MGTSLNGKVLGKGITQRKDGRYFARAIVNGQEISMYGLNIQKLKREFIQAKRDALELNMIAARKDISLNNWFEEWYEIYKKPTLKKSSTYVYKRQFVNLCGARIGTKELKSIKPIHIQTCVADLIACGYSPDSIKNAIRMLNQCFETAIINDKAIKNPCIGITFPKSKPIKQRVLSQREQDIFLNYVSKADNWYAEMYHIMFLTGMRIGEIGGLQDEDIDFANRVIYVKRTLSSVYVDGNKIEELTSPKTNDSYRTIPFFSETEHYLRAQIDKRNIRKEKLRDEWRGKPLFGNLVFCTSMGSPSARYAIQRNMNTVVNTYNKLEELLAQEECRHPVYLEKMHPHCIRHTVATRLLEKEMHPRVVQNILGHSDYNTTLLYSHALNDFTKAEAKKIGNLLEPTTQIDNQNMYNKLAGIL